MSAFIASSSIGSANLALISSNSFKQIDGRLDRLLDDLLNGLRLVQLRLLLEIADRVALRKNDLAVKIFVGARDDPQQATIFPPVQTEHADLRPVKKRKVDVLEDRLLVVKLTDLDHRKDDLVWFRIAHIAKR